MQYKKKEISEKILSAGRREYLEKGFRGGNISAIAQEAGVPVGNLYRYYDGKMGLLTAIVKPAYTQVPKIINEFVSSETDADLRACLLTDKMLEVFDKYGSDLLILADKCATTRYEDFFDRLVDQFDRLLLKRLFPEGADENDAFFSYTVSKSFLSAVFDVLRRGGNREETREMLSRLVKFFFTEATERVKKTEKEPSVRSEGDGDE